MSGRNLVKRIGLVRRRKDLSVEEFERHWLTVHADLCKKLPNLRFYAVNLIRKDTSHDIGYDGFSELWYDDEETLNASLQSPEGKTLLADLPNFTDAIHPLVVEEHKMI